LRREVGNPMDELLQVEGLSGGYLPGKPVLHDLTFSVRRGEMVGLIGLNGAGKSTTIKHILGLMPPHKGRIAICGSTLEQNPEAYRQSFGYVPETPELYDELTISDHFRLTAMVYGISGEIYENRVERLAELFRLGDKLGSLPGHLSKGMRQKVMLLNAFLIEPPLYIIDEPFVGLDPLAIRSLLELMAQRKAAGSGFLISSHVLSTLERYCDRLIVLREGRIAVQGTMSDLRRASGISSNYLDDLFYALTGGNGRV